MEFFRFFERLLPHNLLENMAAVTDNNNITREPCMKQYPSDFDKNSNIIDTEGNITVNSSEYVSTNFASSVDNIDEFSVIKTLHYLENVTPFEITTNDNTYEESMENEISLIEEIISNSATGASLVINDIEDLIDGHVINKTNNYLEEIKIRHDAETSNAVLNTEANTTYNNVLNDENMQNLDLVGNIFENNEDAICEERECAELNNNIDIITIDSSIKDEMSQIFKIKDTVSMNNRYDAEVSNDVRNTEANTTYNNVLNDETMQNLDLVGNIFENNENATCEERECAELNNNIDIITIDSSTKDEMSQKFKIKDTVSINNGYDAEVSNDVRNTEANTTYNNVLNDETMQSLDLVGNIFENNENAACEEKECAELNNEIKKNIDIITIDSSTEDEMSQKFEFKDIVSINDSDETESDGYNSSDFEFISETEAKMAGIVINHGIEKHQKLSQTSSEPIIFCFNEENHQRNEESDPGEGTSRQNRPRNEFEDRSYRNNHHIPIGDDYLGLFQGIYNPLMPMSEILFLENKSTRASAMNMQYDGIGFDKQLAMRRHQPDSSEDEFEDEAKESAKKILKMYPGENRKRRRRYL